MISINEAFECYSREISPLPVQEVPLQQALWRVLAEDVCARTDLPPFPQSAMDGYALRAADTRGASRESPVRLRLAGEISAGPLPEIPQLNSKEAMRIFTGGHMPSRADAVLRQEAASVEGGELLVTQPLHPGMDLRERGEEVLEGERLAKLGSRLRPGHVAAFAAAGTKSIPVRRAPRISVLITGDELVESGWQSAPGEVFDANTPLLMSWLCAYGYADVRAARLADDLRRTEQALEDAFSRSDLVITAGGMSVGDRDFVRKASQRIGVREVFSKIRQQPGKPLFLGTYEGKPLLGLPGNPGAVFVCLITHVRRVLDLMEGALPLGPAFAAAQISQPLDPSPKGERWVRCELEISSKGEAWLSPLAHQAPHMITSLVDCTALARLPEGTKVLERGTLVPWTPVTPL